MSVAKNILWLLGAEDTTKWYLRACSLASVRSVCMLCERCLIKEEEEEGDADSLPLPIFPRLETEKNIPIFRPLFVAKCFNLFCLPLFYGAVKRGSLGGGDGAKRQHTWVYSGWSPYLSLFFFFLPRSVASTWYGIANTKERRRRRTSQETPTRKFETWTTKVSESYGRFREAPLEEILLQNFGL